MGRDAREQGKLLAEAVDITVRIRDVHLLQGTTWRIREGEHWAVVGPNGSGKSSLVRVMAGIAPTSAGRVSVHTPAGFDGVAYVSFEEQERLVRPWGANGAGTPKVRDFIPGAEPPWFRFGAILDRELSALSAGELRRVLIARELRRLGRPPGLLILDEPFDGLDTEWRRKLADLLRGLARRGVATVLVTHRAEELLPETTHLLLVRGGRVVAQGARDAALEAAARDTIASRQPAAAEAQAEARPRGPGIQAEPLVEMRGVTVRYDETVVLAGLDWTVSSGEHWAILGPNGSGKTTLLELIHGDNLQAYSNDVRVFGRRRGTGESLWDIRRRIGFVSPEFQMAYGAELTARDVIVSGFADSIGLYYQPGPEEVAAAEGCAARLGLGELAARPYGRLSSGERRLVLVARAAVKEPEILIMDEPCQGLDAANRAAVLELLDRVGRSGRSSLLYVSHLSDELPSCLTHRLRLGPPRAVIERAV